MSIVSVRVLAFPTIFTEKAHLQIPNIEQRLSHLLDLSLAASVSEPMKATILHLDFDGQMWSREGIVEDRLDPAWNLSLLFQLHRLGGAQEIEQVL